MEYSIGVEEFLICLHIYVFQQTYLLSSDLSSCNAAAWRPVRNVIQKFKNPAFVKCIWPFLANAVNGLGVGD